MYDEQGQLCSLGIFLFSCYVLCIYFLVYLKAMDTIGFVKDQYSLLVQPNTCIQFLKKRDNFDSIGRQSCKRKMKKKK